VAALRIDGKPANRAKGTVRRVAEICESSLANPVFAYGLAIVLQLRVVWGIWDSKDLEVADGSQYFFFATTWTHALRHDIVWSPLYTDYWGTVLAAVENVYAASLVERLLIVFAGTLLLLALMRALTGPVPGLLVALWWAVLPVNYAVLFEVHLFAFLPVLVAALIVVRTPDRIALGAALGVLTAAALLIRTEIVIAVVVLAVGVLIRELRERRIRRVRLSAYARAYGIPLLVICLLGAGAYWRSFDQGNNIRVELNDKHTRNLCQVYAYYYWQRFPDRFTGNPFAECLPLMQQTFGRPLPTLLQAVSSNPRAIAAFAAWNTRLLPSGLQASIFGASGTRDNPDFVPVKTRRTYPWLLSLVLAGILAAGAVAIRRDTAHWRRWLEVRKWSLVVLGGSAATALFVAWVERPRPEYIYGLSVSAMAAVGICAAALLRRFHATTYAALGTCVVAALLLVLLPRHYHPGPRPLHDAVERLWVVHRQLERPGSVLIASAYNAETCGYLAKSVVAFCTSQPWAALSAEVSPSRSLSRVLDDAHATVIYADPSMQSDPKLEKLLATPRAFGWRQVSAGESGDGPWSVLVHVANP
jgi:hypothetical protein